MITNQVPENSLPAKPPSVRAGAPKLFLPDLLARLFGAVKLLHRLLTAVAGAVHKVAEDVSAIRTGMANITRFQACLEAASRQQELLSERHYIEHVIDPLTTRLSGLIDLTGDHLAQCPAESPEGAMDIVQAIRQELIDLLASYKVEIRYAEPGAAYEPNWMKQAKVVSTSRQADDGKVARTIRCGFSRRDCLLRPALVAIWQFEASSDSLFDSQNSKGDLT